MEWLVLDFSFILTLFIIGIFTGILAGFFGIGGGAIIVPLMILLGNDIKIAIGISIMQMIFSSIYGSYINYRQNNLEFKDSLYVGLGGLIGAAFSGIVVDRIPSNILEGFFTLFILYSLVKLFKANAYGGESPFRQWNQRKTISHRLRLCRRRLCNFTWNRWRNDVVSTSCLLFGI